VTRCQARFAQPRCPRRSAELEPAVPPDIGDGQAPAARRAPRSGAKNDDRAPRGEAVAAVTVQLTGRRFNSATQPEQGISRTSGPRIACQKTPALHVPSWTGRTARDAHSEGGAKKIGNYSQDAKGRPVSSPAGVSISQRDLRPRRRRPDLMPEPRSSAMKRTSVRGLVLLADCGGRPTGPDGLPYMSGGWRGSGRRGCYAAAGHRSSPSTRTRLG